MSRRIEKIIAIVGAVLVVIFMGGFSLTIYNMDEAAFQEVIVPIFIDTMPQIGTEVGYETMRTLAAWFGITTFLTVALVALANLFVSNNRYPKRAAVFYGVTGIVVLIGSQMIAYPLAFFFFVTMGLCFLRKEEDAEEQI